MRSNEIDGINICLYNSTIVSHVYEECTRIMFQYVADTMVWPGYNYVQHHDGQNFMKLTMLCYSVAIDISRQHDLLGSLLKKYAMIELVTIGPIELKSIISPVKFTSHLWLTRFRSNLSLDYPNHFSSISFLWLMYSISQEIYTRFLLCCALLWLYIDGFSLIHQA